MRRLVPINLGFIPLGVCAWLAHAMLELPILQAHPGTLRLSWGPVGRGDLGSVTPWTIV